MVGGTPEENAALVKEILEGKVTGAKLDAVLINAGAAIHVAKNVSMEEGIKEAREMITSGKGACNYGTVYRRNECSIRELEHDIR